MKHRVALGFPPRAAARRFRPSLAVLLPLHPPLAIPLLRNIPPPPFSLKNSSPSRPARNQPLTRHLHILSLLSNPYRTHFTQLV
jgi:hypothetical protein